MLISSPLSQQLTGSRLDGFVVFAGFVGLIVPEPDYNSTTFEWYGQLYNRDDLRKAFDVVSASEDCYDKLCKQNVFIWRGRGPAESCVWQDILHPDAVLLLETLASCGDVRVTWQLHCVLTQQLLCFSVTAFKSPYNDIHCCHNAVACCNCNLLIAKTSSCQVPAHQAIALLGVLKQGNGLIFALTLQDSSEEWDLNGDDDEECGDVLMWKAKEYASADTLSGYDACKAHQLFAGAALLRR